MAKGPTKSVNVDEDNAHDPTSRRASDSVTGRGGSGEAQVDSEVQHRSGLHTGADEERKSATDATVETVSVKDGLGDPGQSDSLYKVGHVEDGRHKLDNAVDSLVVSYQSSSEYCKSQVARVTNRRQ